MCSPVKYNVEHVEVTKKITNSDRLWNIFRCRFLAHVYLFAFGRVCVAFFVHFVYCNLLSINLILKSFSKFNILFLFSQLKNVYFFAN